MTNKESLRIRISGCLLSSRDLFHNMNAPFQVLPEFKKMNRGRLKTEDECCIKENYIYLKDNIEAKELVDYLFQNSVISENDKEEIQCGKTKYDRNECLLKKILNSGPNEAFSIFLNA
ncbi:Immune-associated nucleotide-binding protein 12 [Biomphalaria glabrata]|nr:death domain-containing protein CRADD-like [Biomphalaria glabrata]